MMTRARMPRGPIVLWALWLVWAVSPAGAMFAQDPRATDTGPIAGGQGMSGEASRNAARLELPSQRVEVGRERPSLPPSSAAAHASRQTAPPTGLALPPRSKESREARPAASEGRRSSATTVVGSLALVIGLFFFVAWLSRRATPQANQALPGDVVQVLGRTPLAGRQLLQLVRVGQKLVLIAVHAGGTTAITEVTDRDEVERLCGLCERQRPTSITASFRQVLQQFGDERAAPGFLGEEHRADLHFAAERQD